MEVFITNHAIKRLRTRLGITLDEVQRRLLCEQIEADIPNWPSSNVAGAVLDVVLNDKQVSLHIKRSNSGEGYAIVTAINNNGGNGIALRQNKKPKRYRERYID